MIRPQTGLARPSPGGRGLLLALLLGLTLLAAPATLAKPGRIVSINLCTDQLLLLLADRDRIVSLSFIARDSGLSYMAKAAAGIPVNYGSAEEVLALHPDLIVAGQSAAGPTTRLLRRLGFQVLELPLAESLGEVARQIRTMARALEEVSRGERLLRDLEERLAAVRQRAAAGPHPTAAIYQASGLTIGRHSLADDLLKVAGLRNLAPELSVPEGGYLPLELLLQHPPDRLVIDEYRPDLPSLAQQFLRHPALRRVERDRRTISLPARLWTCAGPGLAEAAERLQRP
mgnify:CR=1 FL=1